METVRLKGHGELFVAVDKTDDGYFLVRKREFEQPEGVFYDRPVFWAREQDVEVVE